MSRSDSPASLGASGEATDLWLETELFMDVRLETGEWLECESIEVRQRWLCVRFLARTDLEPIWLNVDTDIDRLAELHTKSGGAAEEKEAKRIATMIATSKEGMTPTSTSTYDNIDETTVHHIFREVLTRSIEQLKRQFDTIENGSSASSSSSSSPPSSPSSSFLMFEAQKRLQSNDDANKMPTKTMSCMPSMRHHTPAAASSSSSASPSSMVDDTDIFTVSAISIKLPLFDSHTHLRMSIPVRSSQCYHPESFDLLTHICTRLELVDQQPIWTCPLCKKEAFADDLIMDVILLHILRIIEDGRLQQYASSLVPAASSSSSSSLPTLPSLTFTPNSELMSNQSFRTSIESLESFMSKPPSIMNRHSLSPFEERRLTLTLSNHTKKELRMMISTEAEDSNRRDIRRQGFRRARTLPTTAKEIEQEEELNGTPSKKQARTQLIDGTHTHMASTPTPTFAGFEPAASSSTMHFDVASSSGASSSPLVASSTYMSDIAIASSSSSSNSTGVVSSLPWPSWIDSNGFDWIDLRSGPDDIEGSECWSKIQVKIEDAHRTYMEIKEKQHAQFHQPPPPITTTTATLPNVTAPPAVPPNNLLGLMKSMTPKQRQAYMQQAGLGMNSPPSPPTSPSATPPFTRAATLPARSSQSLPKKLRRNKSSVAAKSSSTAAAAAASSSSSSSSAPASSSGAPLIPINTCSMYDLLTIDGVGEKMAKRIIDARYERWMNRKVKWNDSCFDEQKAQQQSNHSASSPIAVDDDDAPGTATGARAPCECETPQLCRHVVAFQKLKTLGKIDGIGQKMLDKLKLVLTTT